MMMIIMPLASYRLVYIDPDLLNRHLDLILRLYSKSCLLTVPLIGIYWWCINVARFSTWLMIDYRSKCWSACFSHSSSTPPSFTPLLLNFCLICIDRKRKDVCLLLSSLDSLHSFLLFHLTVGLMDLRMSFVVHDSCIWLQYLIRGNLVQIELPSPRGSISQGDQWK